MKKILILFILSFNLLGSGFAVPEQSARSVAMGNAYTSIADDPSAIFYNPAGINQMTGLNFDIGLTTLIPSNTFKSDTTDKTTETNFKTFYMPQFNITYKINPKMSAGFGFSAPYGLGIEWPNAWEGADMVEMMNLQTINFSPAFAYEIISGLSIGVTYDLGLAVVELRKKTMLGEESLISNMASSEYSIGHGFKAGIHYTKDRLRTGLVFKFGQKYEIKGNADFDVTSDVFSGKKPIDQKMTTEMTIPNFLAWGISYEFIKNVLLVSFDVNYTMWSSYDELKLTFEEGIPNSETGEMDKSVTTEKNWEDVLAFRMGLEYKINNLKARLGYGYDIEPIPNKTIDPSLPGNNRHIFNGGIGYGLSFVNIDLAYTYLIFEERKTTNELFGTYNGNVHIITFTSSFKF